ncbi:MAG: AMP-dependent synthetase/ligase, partial [Kiloniellales bacterium]
MNPERYGRWQNLATMFFEVAAERGDRPFLWAKRDGEWEAMSWPDAAQAVSRLSRALRGLGVEAGDRVALVSENRPEWLICDVAIMAARGIAVPAYTTNTVGDHHHILTNSGAKGVIVSDARLAEPLMQAVAKAPAVRFVIAMAPIEGAAPNDVRVLGWGEAMDLGASLPDDTTSVAAAAARSDTCCLIYTSGTGGLPKGVMLSHGAILCNCKGAYIVLESLGIGDEVFLSFLPLSHSYEHSAGQFFPISIGAEIYYAERADRLVGYLPEVRPTIMTAVPRLYETMHRRIVAALERQGGLKAKLFWKAHALGCRRYQAPGSLSLGERLMDAVLERLVRDKMRQRFGGRLKAMVSGGAPLNYEIGLFFTALGLRILQGYGLTESAPVVSCNPPHKPKLHTVGPALADVEARIADDGEILVRGELVMQGYWGMPEATAEAVVDGWLLTGDIGRIDEDGYLQITERKKDIIVSSGGDNISPQRVEGFLTLQPEIDQAMVYGDRRPYLVGLLVPDADFLAQWAEANGRPQAIADPAADEALHQALTQVVERVNRELALTERVRHFLVAAEPFTVDNEMMTPTLKIRRHKIEERYGEA